MNAFFDSQFKYYPLKWIGHSCTNNKKIDRLFEKCPKIIFNNKQSSFKDLLEMDSSASVRERNEQTLATEICKVSSSFPPEVRNEHPYSLRQNSAFQAFSKLRISRN